MVSHKTKEDGMPCFVQSVVLVISYLVFPSVNWFCGNCLALIVMRYLASLGVRQHASLINK